VHAEEYRRLYDLEDRYWWFVARRRLALNLLRRALHGCVRPTVLDLGCGTGAVEQELRRWAVPIGLDMSPLALGFCKKRGLENLVQADGTRLPFRESSVDGVIALDVFEHIEDHETAFSEALRVLRHDGVLVLSVPAFRSLWGPHDVALMHKRRYRLGEVKQVLSRAGFKVERVSYSVHVLFPVVVLTRMLEKLKRGTPRASLPMVPGWLNRALIALQDCETLAIQRLNLPWGSSVVAVARRP